MSVTIHLPWPPASLSGHAKANWHGKAADTRKHRAWAHAAALAARKPDLPAIGDIDILFRFVPPNRRGDRTNFPTRIKPLIDGLAQAWGVNDSRFLPSYAFDEPCLPGEVVVIVSEQSV